MSTKVAAAIIILLALGLCLLLGFILYLQSGQVSSLYHEKLNIVRREEDQMRSVGLDPEKTPGYPSKLLAACEAGDPRSQAEYNERINGLESYYEAMKALTPPTFPTGSDAEWDMQKWAWCDDCKTAPRFIVKTQWPTFLDEDAWDDGCQGSKSIPATSTVTPDCQQNNSKDSFQIAGQWMRISQRNLGSASNVSTANSKEHWFNPPRDKQFIQPGEKEDDPLEIEWFMHMDASNMAKTVQDLVDKQVANVNWSAFWSFGHGRPANLDDPTKNNYGWPYGGEWDLAESLPAFSNIDNLKDKTVIGRGIASGFHNGASGAFPPCCLKRDGVMFPKPTLNNSIAIAAFPAVTGNMGSEIQAAKSQGKQQEFLVNNNDDIYYFPSPSMSGQPFLSWGQAIFEQKYGRKPKGEKDDRTAAVLTLNNTIHCMLRVTTRSAAIWIMSDADPTKELNVDVNSGMTQDEYGNALKKVGFVQVFSSYGDFGSNNDTTFSDQFDKPLGQVGMEVGNSGKYLPFKGTNWHQNMMFVWSVITQMNNSGRYTNTNQAEFWQHFTSYMSDIHIRGGGDYTKALRPAGMPTEYETKIATVATDPSSRDVFLNKELGHYSCSNKDHKNIPANIDCLNILV